MVRGSFPVSAGRAELEAAEICVARFGQQPAPDARRPAAISAGASLGAAIRPRLVTVVRAGHRISFG